MNKRKTYLPSLLAFGIATALESGTFAYGATDKDNHTTSLSTTAPVQQEQEQEQERKPVSLRSSFGSLMQQALRQAQQNQIEPETETEIETAPSNPQPPSFDADQALVAASTTETEAPVALNPEPTPEPVNASEAIAQPAPNLAALETTPAPLAEPEQVEDIQQVEDTHIVEHESEEKSLTEIAQPEPKPAPEQVQDTQEQIQDTHTIGHGSEEQQIQDTHIVGHEPEEKSLAEIAQPEPKPAPEQVQDTHIAGEQIQDIQALPETTHPTEAEDEQAKDIHTVDLQTHEIQDTHTIGHESEPEQDIHAVAHIVGHEPEEKSLAEITQPEQKSKQPPEQQVAAEQEEEQVKDSHTIEQQDEPVQEVQDIQEPEQVKDAQITKKNPLSISLADKDWSARLGRRSSWPADQERLGPRTTSLPEKPKVAPLSEDEVERSVLLSRWLDKAKRHSSWQQKDIQLPAPPRREKVLTNLIEDTQTLAKGSQAEPKVEDSQKLIGDSHKLTPIQDSQTIRQSVAAKTSKAKEPTKVYTDDWLTEAAPKTAWADDLAKQQLAEQTGELDNSGMTLISSIVLENESADKAVESTPPAQARPTPIAPTSAVAATVEPKSEPKPKPKTAPIPEVVATKPAPAPAPSVKPKPNQSFGASMLAYQGAAPTQIAPPRSVKSAQQSAGLRAALGQAQLKGAPPVPEQPTMTIAQATKPQGQTANQNWLPDLEVTPGERLAKVKPQTTPAANQRNLAWQPATPEQWQTAPSGTQLPSTYKNTVSAAYVMPDQIQLPSRTTSKPAAAHQINNADTVQSWSLVGGTVEIARPQIEDPISTPTPTVASSLEQEPWPDPVYTAQNRLAPAMPSFANQPSWSGASKGYIQDRQEHSPDALQKRQGLNEYRRPPPITPKDIYHVAAQEESTPVHRASQPKTDNTRRFTTPQQPGPSSIDRFRERVSEPAAMEDSAPQPPTSSPEQYQPVQPNLTPRWHVQQERIQKQGLQQVSQRVGHSNYRLPPNVTLEQMLKASNYSLSIQWAVSTNPAEIRQLRQRYPLLSDATVVRFKSLGEDWYLLLTGIYPDKASATSALQSRQYQAMAKQLKPWVRSLKGVKALKLLPNTPAMKQAPQMATLPQGEYTIQWQEASDPETLRELRSRYVQLADAEIVMVSRNQQVRYMLIQGRFSSYQTVADTLQNAHYSPLARLLAPKPRPMASLRHHTNMSYASSKAI